MRIVELGEGTPEVAVVGGIHGDEPCGYRAVRALMGASLEVQQPVKLVVANELAIERGVRYVDTDLNRSFLPTVDDEDYEYPAGHEGALARKLIEELRGCLVLGLHSTKSHPKPFAIVSDPTERERDVVTRLPVEAVVESGPYTDGRLIDPLRTIEVECGYQGSDRATENAHAVTDAFLRATGVLPDRPPVRELPYFRLFAQIRKEEAAEYEVFVDNFREVAVGEAYAATAGRPHYATEPFVPVLMSPDGYEDLFGYAATRIGSLP